MNSGAACPKGTVVCPSASLRLPCLLTRPTAVTVLPAAVGVLRPAAFALPLAVFSGRRQRRKGVQHKSWLQTCVGGICPCKGTAFDNGGSLPGASFHVLHVDPDLLFVDKDAGLLTVPGIGPAKADSLLTRLQAPDLFPEATRVPHRLDRDTSGLLAIGRSKEAHRHLAVQFQERQVQKRYEALVWGWPNAYEGQIDLSIGKFRSAPGQPAEMVVVHRGARTHAVDDVRPCSSRWRVMARYGAPSIIRGTTPCGIPCARVALEPLTGRSRQLRLHMAAIGHPILGDTKHGNNAAVDGVARVANATYPRLLLHATFLRLLHPGTGEPVEATSAVPF